MSKKMKLIIENFNKYLQNAKQKEVLEEGAFSTLIALAGGVQEPMFIDGNEYEPEVIQAAVKQIAPAYKNGNLSSAQAKAAVETMSSAIKGELPSTQLGGYDVSDGMEALLIGSKRKYDRDAGGGSSVLDIDGEGAHGGTGQNIDGLLTLMTGQRGAAKVNTAKKIKEHPGFNDLPQNMKDSVYTVLANTPE